MILKLAEHKIKVNIKKNIFIYNFQLQMFDFRPKTFRRSKSSFSVNRLVESNLPKYRKLRSHYFKLQMQRFLFLTIVTITFQLLLLLDVA